MSMLLGPTNILTLNIQGQQDLNLKGASSDTDTNTCLRSSQATGIIKYLTVQAQSEINMLLMTKIATCCNMLSKKGLTLSTGPLGGTSEQLRQDVTK